jgi:hypothetical protein
MNERLTLLAACLVSVLGGMLAKWVQRGVLPFWVATIPAVSTGLLWGYASKISQNLPRLSVAFDLCLSVAYMVGLLIMGERLTWQQATGFAVSMCGLAMMR